MEEQTSWGLPLRSGRVYRLTVLSNLRRFPGEWKFSAKLTRCVYVIQRLVRSINFKYSHKLHNKLHDNIIQIKEQCKKADVSFDELKEPFPVFVR